MLKLLLIFCLSSSLSFAAPVNQNVSTADLQKDKPLTDRVQKDKLVGPPQQDKLLSDPNINKDKLQKLGGQQNKLAIPDKENADKLGKVGEQKNLLGGTPDVHNQVIDPHNDQHLDEEHHQHRDDEVREREHTGHDGRDHRHREPFNQIPDPLQHQLERGDIQTHHHHYQNPPQFQQQGGPFGGFDPFHLANQGLQHGLGLGNDIFGLASNTFGRFGKFATDGLDQVGGIGKNLFDQGGRFATDGLGQVTSFGRNGLGQVSSLGRNGLGLFRQGQGLAGNGVNQGRQFARQWSNGVPQVDQFLGEDNVRSRLV